MRWLLVDDIGARWAPMSFAKPLPVLNNGGMKLTTAAVAVAAAVSLSGSSAAQERKPVPKDSVRLSLPGCTKGYVFTAGRRTVDEPGMFEIPEGMHLRMNGKKELMSEIKAHEGSRIEITGVMKRGQYREGVDIGKGVRISPGPPQSGGGIGVNMAPQQTMIDVEGWRPLDGACPTR
jgi:hypothetical protein